ncbi:hypothetical protein D3C71_803740 [compost metagenome]
MFLSGAGQHLQAGLVDLGDDGRLKAADGALLGQFGGPRFTGLARQARLGTAIAVTLIVSHQAFMDGGIGHFLKVARHRGGDAETFGVRVAAIATDHFGTGHFGDVRRVHFRGRHVIAGVQRLVDRGGVIGFGDFAELVHAPQDPVATFLAAGRVGQRVEARRGLWQTGDHRHLRQADVTNRLAVIDLRRRLDAVGTVAQVDLVDVQLKDFVLGQLPFDLQCQEDFCGFAREAAFAGQEEVLRHLHGDGAAAGLDVAAFDQLGGGPHQAAWVDAIVVGEVVVFST